MQAPQLAPPSRAEILALLRERFGHRRFRPGQEDVLQAILTGRDVVALLPTGAGKSLVFQIASQLLPGLTIVVSPLLALMRDQEESLEDLIKRMDDDSAKARAALAAAPDAFPKLGTVG